MARSVVLGQAMAVSTLLVVSRKEKRRRHKIQKRFLVEAEGVQRRSLLQRQAAASYTVLFRRVANLEYVRRRSPMQAMVTRGTFIVWGCREMVRRQQLTHEGLLWEEETPRRQARLQMLGVPLAQLGFKEHARRQMRSLHYTPTLPRFSLRLGGELSAPLHHEGAQLPT